MARMTTLDEHPLLGARAKALEPDEILAQQVVAESLLQVNDLTVALQADCDRLDAAVVLQINFQVETGIEGYMLTEARRGARHVIYRGKNRMAHVHRQAIEIVRGLKNRLGAW